MLQTILIPTEFKADTERLIEAGVVFSRKTGAKLALLFVIKSRESITATPPYAMHETNKRLYAEDKKFALDSYAKVFDKYKDAIAEESHLELIIEKGDRVTNIISTTNKLNPDLLILPNVHEGLIEKVTGETNHHIINSVRSPVLILDPEKHFTFPEKLAFLTGFHEQAVERIKKLINLTKGLKKSCSVFCPVEEEGYKAHLMMEGFKGEILKHNGKIKLDFTGIPEENKIESIQEDVRKKHIDLLAVENEGESVLSQWLSRTTTDKLMDKLDIPLLVFNN